jgi:hypothetical protein
LIDKNFKLTDFRPLGCALRSLKGEINADIELTLNIPGGDARHLWD